MLRVIVTGYDDPGAADKVTTHVFLRRPDGCIEYMDAMLSPRCMYVGTYIMRKQVAFAMVLRYCRFGWLQLRRPGDFEDDACRGPVTAWVDFSLGEPWNVRVGVATLPAPGTNCLLPEPAADDAPAFSVP